MTAPFGAQAALALGFLGLLTSTVFTGMVAVAAERFLRNGSRGPQSLSAPVSLLKPLHGAEPNLEQQVESFFNQDCTGYEVLFCARHLNDAGLDIARRVAARHPEIPVQFLASGEPSIPNAKLQSLELMVQKAQHDILIISDSDVRVGRDYVRAIAAGFRDPRVGAVTCLYRGCAVMGGFWAGIEAAAMSIEMSAGVLVANMLEGMKFTLGPTMAVRRSSLARIGGFLPMGDYCADDFLLGNRIAELGETVVLSHHVIDHIVLHDAFLPSLRHQVRWMKSTRFSRPKGHLGTALTFSVPFGILSAAGALAAGLPGLAGGLLAWSIGSRMLMAALLGRRVLHERPLWRVVLLYPLRDLMALGFWAASYASRRILWRGEWYELEPGGRMRRVG
jgi:ceramide glucosyltransferase